MKSKNTKTLVSLLLVCAMALWIPGCDKKDKKNGTYDYVPPKAVEPETGIVRLNFVPATGYYKVNSDTHHCFYIDPTGYWDRYDFHRPDVSFMVFNDYDLSLLSSESAFEFIKEVEAIPDSSEKNGPFAYKIDMEYKDKDGTRHTVLKKGYGKVPDNWIKIVKLANDLTMQRLEIPYDTKITVIDAEYLIKYYHIRPEYIPHGVSLDDMIKELNITYEYLYDETTALRTDHMSLDYLLDKYAFDYLKMTEYSYFENTTHQISSPEELKEYAEKHLTDIKSSDELSIGGTFNDQYIEIVRSDHFEAWKRANGVENGPYKHDKSINLKQYEEAHKNEPTYGGKLLECYIDPSKKFIIILPDSTGAYGGPRNYNIVYDFFHQGE